MAELVEFDHSDGLLGKEAGKIRNLQDVSLTDPVPVPSTTYPIIMAAADMVPVNLQYQ